MTQPEQIERQRTLIRERLGPSMTRKCVLLDCPYYSNIGDTLIWEGELAFLKECGCRIIAYGSIDTWNYRPLAGDVQIILRGGGNFGDVWREHHEKRMKVFEVYTGHRITVFPQTVHYDDPALMTADAERLAAHPDLTICARDQSSFDLLSRNFRNKILLVPDLAFYIDPESLRQYALAQDREKVLYLKRSDKELGLTIDESVIPAAADVSDWPTFEREYPVMTDLYRLFETQYRFNRKGKYRLLRPWVRMRIDRFAMRQMRPALIEIGVRFLSPYGTVYTTRLHTMILAMLLNTERIVSLDNNYGKLSSYYETWLAGTDGIERQAATYRKI